MIAIVIREMPFLKVLTPIIREIHKAGQPYVLYYSTKRKPGKEYACPTLDRIETSAKDIIENAKRTAAFTTDDHILKHAAHDKVTKLVSIEIWLCSPKLPARLRKQNIKSYSVQWLTDSMCKPSVSITSIDRVYYASEHIMKLHQRFSGTTFNPKRDKCLGYPLFEVMEPTTDGKDILVMTPNIRAEHVQDAFGGTKNFVNIIKKLSESGELIFKTRKKQWIPPEAKVFAKEIIDDGEKMYPPSIVDAFKRCHTAVIFYSTGIFEVVSANNYVINITMPLKLYSGTKEIKREYLLEENGIYRFPGVVESVDQKTVLSEQWKPVPRKIDPERREAWMKKFVGSVDGNSAKLIANDIIKN